MNAKEKELALYGKKYPNRIVEMQTLSVKNWCGCRCNGRATATSPTTSKPYPAQSSRVISLMPDLGQGFMVFNKQANPTVVTWRVSIHQKLNDMDPSYPRSSVYTQQVSGSKNYWKVPLKYRGRSGNYAVTVDGMDRSGRVVVSEGPIHIGIGPDTALCVGCNSWPKRCSWVCNGKGYAWEINLHQDPNSNGYILNLQTAYALFDENQQIAVPFYTYYRADLFDQLYQNPQSPTFIEPLPIDGVNVIGPLNSQLPNPLKDEDGAAIIGVVYGVAKNLGPWEGQFWQTPILDDSPVSCSSSNRSWAINQMNLYSNIPPELELECIPSWQDVDLPGGSGQGVPNCLFSEIFQSAVEDNFGDDGIDEDFPISGPAVPGGPFISINHNADFVTNYMDAVTDCYCDNDISLACNGLEPATPGRRASVIDEVKVISLGSDQGKVVFATSPEKSIRTKSSASSKEVVINPGLYCLGTSLKNGSYLPVIVELKRPHVVFEANKSQC